MSVVDTLRRDAVAQKNHELLTTYRAHSAKTRALRAITNLLKTNATLPDLSKLITDAENDSPTTEDYNALPANNDLANGRHFDESSISYPSLSDQDASIYASKLNRPSVEPSDRVQRNSGVDVVASDGTTSSDSQPASSFESIKAAKYDTDASTSQDVGGQAAVPATYSQKASRESNSPGVVPDDVAPPQPEEEAEFDGATQQLLDLQHPQKPAKVVHLPREDVHESEAHRRKRSEDTESKASRSHAQAQAELASSPSSTVGAYSAATPMPPQDSPDTSPDSESGEQIAVLPPKDLRPSPAAQREKEEHDRILEAQKEIARRQALGDVSSPDEQLRWEEREAAARDAEEKTAREDVNGPEPDAKDVAEETMAEEVAEEVEQAEAAERNATAAPNQDREVRTSESNDDRGLQAPQDDDDNITVTPRNRAALTIDTSMQHAADGLQQPTPAENERMTTRTSSGALQKRSVSEILGQTPSHGGQRRIALSPETLSPMTMRHAQDTPIAVPIGSFTAARSQSPRRPSRQPGLPRTPSNAQSVLEELATLKGAAEDPDRDYLESLFRIQAHDSPNVQTKPLTELLRTSTKTLTTEDQFTATHERLDYRILRRIYQLQNANKWSLRQMERSPEVPEPMSHMDHMMAEMKWMRKDFHVERKMKRNICAWLARRCAEWVAASDIEKQKLRVKVKVPTPKKKQSDEIEMIEDSAEPDLEHSGESAPEDEAGPPTPKNETSLPSNLVVPPDLSHAVSELEKMGKLHRALVSLPKAGFTEAKPHSGRPLPGQGDRTQQALSQVSKFAQGKVLPKVPHTGQKRSRFDYEDEADALVDEAAVKRLAVERDLPSEDQEMALFHPDNKSIRDRLHANNAFRPPSEHVMPATQFYEFRSGSQWIWEDDLKLRKLAKEYSFNWSLIADELQLPPLFKSSAERRTPWECFERWVELEQLPTEMRKTMYFKTWFSRLEQSQKAAEERYQRQIAALQQQSGGHAQHVPLRRRTMPSRVDKRRNARYLWLVDAMRKGARKKEQAAFKQAESQRAAAQRKSQNDNNQPRAPMMTPQEFSKKRHEHDMKIREQAMAQKQRMLEAQRKQWEAARQAAMQQQNGAAGANQNQQQRPQPGQPNGQMPAVGQQAPQLPNGQYPQQGTNVNGQQQMPQQQLQQRQGQQQAQVQMATRNGHLAVPQVNGQGMAAQAQMRAPSMNGQVPDAAQMQRYAQAQAQAQARQQQQFAGQQAYGSMQSPNNGVGMTAQQTMQSSQAMMASLKAQMNQTPQQQGANINQAPGMSPSMPPPPTPHQQNANVGALSSGHTPVLVTVQKKLRQQYPQCSEEQILQMATQWLKDQSQSASTQARQNAMNAAAGINNVGSANNMQAYGYNQNMAYQNAGGPMVGAGYAADGMVGGQTGGASPQQYSNYLRQNQMAQMRQQQQQLQGSPAGSHSSLNMNGSPSMANASPNTASMTPVSPNMQYSQMAGMNMAGMQQRPPSRSATGTPQQRPGSAVGVPNMSQGMGSPGSANGMIQGSPGRVQASMAR